MGNPSNRRHFQRTEERGIPDMRRKPEGKIFQTQKSKVFETAKQTLRTFAKNARTHGNAFSLLEVLVDNDVKEKAIVTSSVLLGRQFLMTSQHTPLVDTRGLAAVCGVLLRLMEIEERRTLF